MKRRTQLRRTNLALGRLALLDAEACLRHGLVYDANGVRPLRCRVDTLLGDQCGDFASKG